MGFRTFLLCLTLTGAVAHATGFGGSSAPSRIPVPAQDFTATVTDLSGEAATLSKVSFNGEVYVYGKKGEADVAVPFERIDKVRISPTDDKRYRSAYITLRDGDTVTVMVDYDAPCYGETSWGRYRIEVEKIRGIQFHHGAATP